jgi:hypothetical protein
LSKATGILELALIESRPSSNLLLRKTEEPKTQDIVYVLGLNNGAGKFPDPESLERLMTTVFSLIHGIED